jgi:hypothetical protein
MSAIKGQRSEYQLYSLQRTSKHNHGFYFPSPHRIRCPCCQYVSRLWILASSNQHFFQMFKRVIFEFTVLVLVPSLPSTASPKVRDTNTRLRFTCVRVLNISTDHGGAKQFFTFSDGACVAKGEIFDGCVLVCWVRLSSYACMALKNTSFNLSRPSPPRVDVAASAIASALERNVARVFASLAAT